MYRGFINGRCVAIKVVHEKPGTPNESGNSTMLAELNHVSRLQIGCDNIVRLLGLSHVQSSGAVCLVYDFANLGSFLQVPADIGFKVAVGLVIDFAKGIQHMHSCSVVHGDIKPDNLLVHRDDSNPPHLKGMVADFGFARVLPRGQDTVVGGGGTRGYIPPEAFKNSRLHGSRARDVYAFGITLGTMFMGLSPEQLLKKIQTLNSNDASLAARRRAVLLEMEQLIARQFDIDAVQNKSCLQILLQVVRQSCHATPTWRSSAGRMVLEMQRCYDHIHM